MKQTEEKLMEQQMRVEARRREMEEKDKIRQRVSHPLALNKISCDTYFSSIESLNSAATAQNDV